MAYYTFKTKSDHSVELDEYINDKYRICGLTITGLPKDSYVSLNTQGCDIMYVPIELLPEYQIWDCPPVWEYPCLEFILPDDSDVVDIRIKIETEECSKNRNIELYGVVKYPDTTNWEHLYEKIEPTQEWPYYTQHFVHPEHKYLYVEYTNELDYNISGGCEPFEFYSLID
jgi:hypothetical protein